MNFIFPMCGASQRFTDAGYTRPKFMLDLYGFTVFEHAVIGFEKYFQKHSFVFVCRDDPAIEAFVKEKCLGLGIPQENTRIVKLPQPTSGQAETVWLGLRQAGLAGSEPMVIFNIDSFQSGFTLPTEFDLDITDGYLEVFIGEGDHWSFVKPGPGHSAIRVTEKQRISELCSTGLYYFRRAQDFSAAFEETLAMDLSKLQGGERYVAPLFNTLIACNMLVKYHLVSAKEVTFCGTPDEYTGILESTAPSTTRALLRRSRQT